MTLYNPKMFRLSTQIFEEPHVNIIHSTGHFVSLWSIIGILNTISSIILNLKNNSQIKKPKGLPWCLQIQKIIFLKNNPGRL